VTLQRLLTRDPASGHELVVTRLACRESGVTIEGEFSLGWIARLTPEQMDFVGLLLARRNNLQQLATDLGVAYNTARARLDEIVAAMGGDPTAPDAVAPAPPAPGARMAVLDALAAGEIDAAEAARRLNA
jgi:hypothetical protein